MTASAWNLEMTLTLYLAKLNIRPPIVIEDHVTITSSLAFEKNNMVLIRFGLLVFIAVVYVEYCIGTWET